MKFFLKKTALPFALSILFLSLSRFPLSVASKCRTCTVYFDLSIFLAFLKTIFFQNDQQRSVPPEANYAADSRLRCDSVFASPHHKWYEVFSPAKKNFIFHEILQISTLYSKRAVFFRKKNINFSFFTFLKDEIILFFGKNILVFRLLESRKGISAMLLNTQGRIVEDMLLWKRGNELLLECSAAHKYLILFYLIWFLSFQRQPSRYT